MGDLNIPHSLHYSFHDSLIIDFAAMPLQFKLGVILFSCQFDSPEWLRDEFLDLFCLVYAEAECWSLAWAISDSDFSP